MLYKNEASRSEDDFSQGDILPPLKDQLKKKKKEPPDKSDFVAKLRNDNYLKVDGKERSKGTVQAVFAESSWILRNYALEEQFSQEDKQNPNHHRPNHHNHTLRRRPPIHYEQNQPLRDHHFQPPPPLKPLPAPVTGKNGRCSGMSRHAILTTTVTPFTGMLDTFTKPPLVHSIGTSVTKPFVLLFENTFQPLLASLWLVAAMPEFEVMSEDMVKDGYENIMNVDISCVAIEMMRRKYEHIPQLKYLQMDVRDMGFFVDNSFDSVIDKGTLDSLMCGTDAPLSASQMLGEVSRILKPGGIYMLITYGDPTVRMSHINRPAYNWKIDLYIIPRPGFQRPAGSTSAPKSHLSPVPTNEKGHLPVDYVLEDPDSHFIYICRKLGENPHVNDSPPFSLTVDF
ncbi:hypothetical protein LXL04_034163 [Taraxacum kok-saghyz]